jgi:hypothetical protein
VNSELIAYAFDEAVQTKPAEIVRHRPCGIGVGISTLKLRHVIAEFLMPKTCGREAEETERVHEGVDAGVAEAEPGGALILYEDG